MSVRGGFAVGFSCFLRVHIASRRWPATGIVWAAQWVGIRTWILQDADLGRERGEGKLLWHSSETWSTPSSNSLVYWDQLKSSLMQKHNYSTSLLAYRTESLQDVTSEFLLWVRNANGKIIKLCVIYFLLKIAIVTLQFVRSFLC